MMTPDKGSCRGVISSGAMIQRNEDEYRADSKLEVTQPRRLPLDDVSVRLKAATDKDDDDLPYHPS